MDSSTKSIMGVWACFLLLVAPAAAQFGQRFTGQ
jgi:hypothetical protein